MVNLTQCNSLVKCLCDVLFEGADSGIHGLLLALHELEICDHFRHVVRADLQILLLNVGHLRTDTIKNVKVRSEPSSVCV